MPVLNLNNKYTQGHFLSVGNQATKYLTPILTVTLCSSLHLDVLYILYKYTPRSTKQLNPRHSLACGSECV